MDPAQDSAPDSAPNSVGEWAPGRDRDRAAGFAAALDALLADGGLPDDVLDDAGLRALWDGVGGHPLAFYELTEAVSEALEAAQVPGAGLSGEGVATVDGFDLTVGGWSIDLRRAGVRAAVMTALLGGVLAQQGFSAASIALVTAVVPSVLDIERVEVRPGDRRLLLDLRLKPEVRTRALTEDQLYAKLPRRLRETVNRYDFADAVARLREAGLADSDAQGRIRLGDPDARRPLVRWR